MPALDRVDEVYVLDLGSGRNVINPDLLAAVSAALDEVVASPPPRALVTTGSGDFFSIGLDLEWIARERDRVGELIDGMHELLARLLELPAPTVAALQRHTLAGGGLLALAHDYRVMRADDGLFAFPEIDVRIAFTQGATDLVTSRLGPRVAHEALTSGRRYAGAEAAAAGIVDELAGADEVIAKSIAIAKRLSGKDPQTYGAIKAALHRDALASLRDPAARSADADRFAFAIELWRRSSPSR
jgi:enoyl-CoA hydratase/carnithine racemase